MAHYGSYGDMEGLLDGDESTGYDGLTEIISGDDGFGDDSGDDSGAQFIGDDNLLGASKRQARSNSVKQAMQRKRIAAGALLRNLPPRSAREFVIGLGSTALPGLSSANIAVQPQVIFRPERIVIPSNLAADFLITDVKVGKNSQLVSPGRDPCGRVRRERVRRAPEDGYRSDRSVHHGLRDEPERRGP